MGSKRKKVGRWLTGAGIAAASVGAILVATAGSAGASIVGDAATNNQAGYSVTGGQFRFASDTFVLPNPAKEPNPVTGFSVKLANGLETDLLGISDGGSGHWNAGFAQEFPDGTVGYSDLASPVMATGDSVHMQLYYDTTSHRMFYTVRDNTVGTVFSGQFVDDNHGVRQSFREVRITADYSTDTYTAASSFTNPSDRVKLAAFKDSRITTYSGHHGSLLDWWQTAPLVMTSDGTMSGHLDSSPGSIWGKGSAYGENFSVFVQP